LKMPCKDSLKRRRANLFRADPHCYWCGREVINIKLKRHQHPPENLATIDHLISRYDDRRGKVVGVRVLSCWKCNHDRNWAEIKAQGLERLHQLSGYQPPIFSSDFTPLATSETEVPATSIPLQ
jgi:hypothetical protein